MKLHAKNFYKNKSGAKKTDEPLSTIAACITITILQPVLQLRETPGTVRNRAIWYRGFAVRNVNLSDTTMIIFPARSSRVPGAGDKKISVRISSKFKGKPCDEKNKKYPFDYIKKQTELRLLKSKRNCVSVLYSSFVNFVNEET